ncbi:MAG: S9 family peptidase [Deltaproteobacteria bacterium]|nr:S9 family peptidase [Deltaproteobacteria bacterium]MDQ3301338.1 S9 family peptidase [Myxococcota bacterium]
MKRAAAIAGFVFSLGGVGAGCGGSKAPPSSPPDLQAPLPPIAAEAAPAQPATPPAPPIARGNPRSDLIPRSLLFGDPERASVRISRDGKWLSWLAPKDGVVNVWVAPVDKLDQARAVTGDKTRPIYQYWWAETSKHLLYLQDTGGDENYHLFRVDLADGTTTNLTPYPGARASFDTTDEKQPTKIGVSINDRDTQVFDYYVIDLLTGVRTLVAQNDEGFVGFTFDNALRPRLAVKKLPDGGTAVFVRDAAAKDPKAGWKPFETVAFEDADAVSYLAVTPNGKAVALDPRGRDTAALVEIDLATKKTKVLAADPKADIGGITMHPTKHTVQAASYEYDRLRWKILDRSLERDFEALKKLDGGEVEVTSRTLDDRRWIVETTSEQHPGRYYLWDRGKQKATFLFSTEPALDTQPLVKMWPVEITARDGLTMMSYLSLPGAADPDGDGKASAPVPMVLYVHGGPWARDTWGFDPLAQLLANRGYAVLSVNYRGSSGFGKKFYNAANLQWGKAMHDDLIDAVGWAVKTGVAPKDKICILGGSYGGYATLVGLTLTPDVFACGVDIVGPSNLLTFMSAIPAYWAPLIAFLHQRVGNPETPAGKAALEAVSPLTHAEKIKKPLLIGQGANDPRVKQAESEQIVAAMTKRGLPVTYVVFPDEGHGFAREVNRIAFFAITEAFLSAHLGGSYQPITADEIKSSTMQINAGKPGIPGLP